jgi:putative FmdB family regulatory protein
MPTYVYECAKCGEEMEEWQSFADEPLKKHLGCGGKLAKVLQPVGIVFKGSGFHRTDSRSVIKGSRSERSDGSSEGKESPDSSGKSEKSDSKSDSPSSSANDAAKKSSDSNSSSDRPDTKKAPTSTSK